MLKKRTATTTAVRISRKWARIRRERAILGSAHRKAITAISHITLPIVNCRRPAAIVEALQRKKFKDRPGRHAYPLLLSMRVAPGRFSSVGYMVSACCGVTPDIGGR
jgi:hypothetical protein